MKIFRICLEIHANPIIVKASVYTPASPAQSSLRTGLAILATAAAIALLYYGRIFFVTLVIAAMIAYLLDPLVEFLMKLRMPRGLASFVACSISLLALYLVALGLYNEGQLMLEDLPAYSSRINELVDGAAERVDQAEQRIYSTVIPRRFREGGEVPPPPPISGSAASRAKKKKPESTEPPPIPEVRVRPETTPLVNYVYDYLRSYYSVFLMASFVPFLVYFILSWRDHLRSRLLAMFEGEARYTISKAMDGVAGMVRTYVVGNFMLGLLLSVLSGILFALLKLPYTIVVAPLSGFLSLVPYIGLPLALIPPLIAALGAVREPAIYVGLIAGVAVLHLLALNLLYPKFVGARVHLNPLVATLALMFWGMLWGAVGLLLAIPITAALKAVCDTVPGLRSYGRLLGD
jgi:predicted PurR-regulated permease PerM